MRPLVSCAIFFGFFFGGCSGSGTDPSPGGDGDGPSSGGMDGGASGGTSSGGAGSGGLSHGAGGDTMGAGGLGSGGLGSGGLGAGGGNSGGEGSGGAGSGGSDGGLGELPTPDCSPAADLGVRIVGRHDGCQEGAVRFSWSGTGFVARLNGTGLRFTHSGGPIQYTVVVDGDVRPDIVTQSGQNSYDAAVGLTSGEHTVEVYRRGEASFGVATLHSVEAIDGELLPPPALGRHIEIFGDSITCGYGNEGTIASCPFSADTENHYLTYGALISRHFEASLSTVAWSGKGVVVNYGGDMSTTLVEMLDRAVPNSDTSIWDYRKSPAPDLVVINLGTNDYSTNNDPSSGEFTETYEQMLTTLRQRYPHAWILCTLGPLLSGSDLATALANINAAVTARAGKGDERVLVHEFTTGNPSPGCDYHPSLATHDAMAAQLIPVIASELGW